MWFHTSNKNGSLMYHTTGCTDEQIDVICGRIAALILEGEDIEFRHLWACAGQLPSP